MRVDLALAMLPSLPRLVNERLADATAPGRDLIEEYRSVTATMHLYATLRFYQVALLLGMTSNAVVMLAAQSSQIGVQRALLLRIGAFAVSLALLVLGWRASSQWLALRERATALARELRFETRPVLSRWNPLSTSGATFYLHACVALLWGASLLMRLAA
jgi:hypothetical protein